MKQFSVYIMANSRRTLYIGVTNNLLRRVFEHRHKMTPGYTAKYNLTKLVHYECFPTMKEAIGREKSLKGWLRVRKTELIEAENPNWQDLAADWYARDPSQAQDDGATSVSSG